MTAEPIRVSPTWLALREPADAAARAPDLVGDVARELRRELPSDGRAVIFDLGCGSGSMARWLAPRLTGPQHWVLVDRDPDLLTLAAAEMPTGPAVSVQTRLRDITRLDPGELAGASLITASALLDMFTAEELDRFVAACVAAGCPTLVTISVIGRVDLAPPDALDEQLASAFNAHQRRTTDGRRLLGPDAAEAARDAFTRLGAQVAVRPSPWRLGPANSALAIEWLTGWTAAAGEQQPELSTAAAGYLRRRTAEAAAGRLTVTVHHVDLLARPR